MGYTHYWYRPLDIPADIFQTIRADFERLVLPLADYGVHLGAGLGEDVPLFADDYICFNGLKSCGHPANSEIGVPWPAPDACGIGPSATAIDEGSGDLMTKIKHRCCNGDCSYDTFFFPRRLDADFALDPDEHGLYFGFTKTAFRPYDIAVTAALLIAKRKLKDQIMVYSDGNDCHWSDAKRICQQVLGYGEWFGIVNEEVEMQSDEGGSGKASQPTLVEISPPTLA